MARWMTAKERQEQEDRLLAELEAAIAETEDELDRTITQWEKSQRMLREQARKARG